MIRKILFFLKLVEVRLRFVAVLVVVALVVGYWDRLAAMWDHLRRPAHAPAPSGNVEWFCPMHPKVVRAESANCPICGMPLVARKKGEKTILPEGVVGRVTLSPPRVAMAGITTVEIGYRPLFREVATVGNLEADERRISRVTALVSGRAVDVSANVTGAQVKTGEPLLRIVSPDLLAAREELASAIRWKAQAASPDAIARAEDMVKGARQRLKLLGLTDAQMDALKPGESADVGIELAAPTTGTVLARSVKPGQQVNAGDVLYEIADLSMLWLQVRVFEDDLGLVETGLGAEVTNVAFPGESFTGTITFVDPIVDPATRTARARIEVGNADGRLKPGMAALAKLRIPVAPRHEVWYGC